MAKNRFGKINDGQVGKSDPRTFSLDDPQPDPIHDVDPSRLDFSKRAVRPRGEPRRHTATDVDKKIQERADQRSQMIEDGDLEDFMLAADPMEEVVSRYAEPGFAYGFLSDPATRVLGRRNYEVVKDERGDPVKLGTLTLGRIPERLKDARRRKQEAESSERVAELANEYAQSVNRLKRDAKDMGLRVLEAGEMTGEFTNTETGRRVNIG
jgi:hypothetical protein